MFSRSWKSKATVYLLVFLLTFSWFFSGWPVIWNNPRFPPNIKEVYAAIPSFQAAGTKATGTTSASVAWPAHQANDIGLLVIETNSQAATEGTSGWVEVTGSPQDATGSRLTVFWKRAASGSEGNATVNVTGGNHIAAQIVTFRGVIMTGNPWDVTAGGVLTVAGTTVTFSSITTTVPNTLIVAIASDGVDSNTAQHSGWTNANLANPNMAEVADINTTTGDGGGVGTGTGGKAAAGATGNTTVTQGSSIAGWLHIALKSQPTTTLGNGAAEPSSTTIGPGDGVTDLDNFTLATDILTDTVTAATVTLGPAGAFNNIAQVDITDSANTAKCTAVTGLTSNSVTFSSCAIPVGVGATAYKVRITSKSHTNMPPPNGASYDTTGTVTDITCANSKSLGDSGSATITVDNASPGEVAGTGGTTGSQQVQLNWTIPGDGDYAGVVVLRRASVAVGDTPTEGNVYIVGDDVGSSKVACVENSAATSCTDNSGLVNGTEYHYKIFTKDSRGNYNTGTVPTGSPFTPQVPVSISITTDGLVNFSYVGLGASVDTSASGFNHPETISIDSGTANLKVRSTAFTAVGNTWNLGAGAGSDQVLWQFSKDGSSWSDFAVAGTEYTFDTGVASPDTRNLYLRLYMPAATDSFIAHSSEVTVVASSP